MGRRRGFFLRSGGDRGGLYSTYKGFGGVGGVYGSTQVMVWTNQIITAPQ